LRSALLRRCSPSPLILVALALVACGPDVSLGEHQAEGASAMDEAENAETDDSVGEEEETADMHVEEGVDELDDELELGQEQHEGAPIDPDDTSFEQEGAAEEATDGQDVEELDAAGAADLEEEPDATEPG
jgi:hypothetical protein